MVDFVNPPIPPFSKGGVGGMGGLLRLPRLTTFARGPRNDKGVHLYNRLIIFLFFIFSSANAYAWSDHYLDVLPALRVMPEINNASPVRVERIETFLHAEKKGLEELLRAEEAWAENSVPEYPPRPDQLDFKATGNEDDLRERFLHAIRINPDVKIALFIELPPGTQDRCKQTIPYRDVATMIDDLRTPKMTFCVFREGERVAPLDVIASASNEPDYEFDIGLWSDNGTSFGLLYGFGKQPFGNPKISYSSRAPFHMGFYHEPKIDYVLVPILKKTYPEYRIHLFQSLARYAFKTDHPYWGYRFMGWGMHYVEDLTQPYHASVIPGARVSHLIWINMMDMLGFHKPKADAIGLVSNRHLVLEDFERDVIHEAYRNHEKDNPVLLALAKTNKDISYGPYNDEFPRAIISNEAHAKADAVNAALTKWMPARFVNDPTYNFDPAVREEHVLDELMEKNKEAVPPLTAIVADLMESFGVFSRSYVRSIIGN